MNSQSGAVTINNAADITQARGEATWPEDPVLIQATIQGGSNALNIINTGTIRFVDQASGIKATHLGDGDINIDFSGAIIGTYGSEDYNYVPLYGIQADTGSGTGNARITIHEGATISLVGDNRTAANITAGSGNASIINKGAIHLSNSSEYNYPRGLYAESDGGWTTIANEGTITGDNVIAMNGNNYGKGMHVVNTSTGKIQIKNGQGISSQVNGGTGDTFIENSGLIQIAAAGATGIAARSYTYNGSQTIVNKGTIEIGKEDTNDGYGYGAGIDVRGDIKGTTSIINTGSIWANASAGINYVSGGDKIQLADHVLIQNTGDITVASTFEVTPSYAIHAYALGDADVDILSGTVINQNGSGIVLDVYSHADWQYVPETGTWEPVLTSPGKATIKTGSDSQIYAYNQTGVFDVAGLRASVLSASKGSEDNNELASVHHQGYLYSEGVGIAAGTLPSDMWVSVDPGLNTTAEVTVGSTGVVDTQKGTIGIDVVTDYKGSVNILAGARVHGGSVAGIVMRPATNDDGSIDATLNNAGLIDAMSDVAITSTGYGGITTSTGSLDINNQGTITGMIHLSEETVTFNNQQNGVLELRNFTDSDGDGVRDTYEIASSDFGTGQVTFNNQGTVSLGAVTGALNAPDSIEGRLLNVDRFEHSGVIDLTAGGAASRAVGGAVGNKLIISGGNQAGIDGGGIFVSNGGQVKLGTVLNEGGANSMSDMLVLDNTSLGANGASNLFITNVGGQGALTQDNGIKVVEVLGDSSAGAFALGNDVLAGAYSYQLGQTGNDWYLTSYVTPIDPTNPGGGGTIPTYRPDVGVDLANRQSVVEMMVPGLAGAGAAPNGILGSGAMRSSLRLGGTALLGQKSSSLWALTTANESKGRAAGGQIGYSANSRTLQIGGDRSFAVGDGLIQAGVMAHMSRVNSKSSNHLTHAKATGDSDGYGVGVYATWFLRADDILSPFVDTYAMYGRYDNTVKTRNNPSSKYHSDAFSFTAQGGYPIALSDTVILEPQVQLTYVDYRSDSYKDHAGTNVDLQTKGNMIGRVGAYVYGHGYKVQPYGAVNVWYDGTQADMRYNTHGATVSADKRGAMLEVKLGAQTQATTNLTLWGEVSGRKGRNSSRDLGGAVGIKYSW